MSRHKASTSLHPPNLLLPRVLVQSTIKVLPPFEQHCVAYQLEPWREFQRVVLEHCLQLALGNVFGVFDFVGVGRQVDIGLDEEYVVDLNRNISIHVYQLVVETA